MRGKLRIIATFMLLIMLLSGCGSKGQQVEPTEAPTPVPTKSPETLEIEKFFDEYVNTTERPIAVMVDNDNEDARPQAGVNEAYLIYEMVVEGGATRFMALFKNADPAKIGPIRSSRHYFLDFVMENDAIYTHFGWSPKAIQDISAYGINKINGVLGEDEEIFWRDYQYTSDYHSAYTSMENIKNKAVKKGFKTETDHKAGVQYSDKYISLETGIDANEVKLVYSPIYTTSYTYDADKMVYVKSINGKPHAMQSGDNVEVKNIIIELITDTSLGDGSARRNINTAGSGSGYYITNGKAIAITWSKASREANTVYKTADGEELLINPGKTIINLIDPTAGITIA